MKWMMLEKTQKLTTDFKSEIECIVSISGCESYARKGQFTRTETCAECCIASHKTVSQAWGVNRHSSESCSANWFATPKRLETPVAC
jgi:hypothetical protein